MMRRSDQDVRRLILSCLESSLTDLGLASADVTDDFDIRASGLVDSLGFVQLIVNLEEQLGFGIDLADVDPEVVTVIGPLCRHISAADSARGLARD